MDRSVDHSTTEPARDGTDTDQSGTAAPDRTDTSDHTDTSAELAQLEDRWRRALADLDNLRKRYAKDLDRERAAEVAKVSAAWLPVLDNLELALAHAGSDPQTVVDGVKATRDQAVQVLARHGFERHDEVGVPFSPELHEVVSVVAHPDLPSGTVVEVVRPGYGAGARQLRPAAVVVSRPEG
ncbi:nucleotide exchange factor GrpE [Gordonia rubripertincta]|uniref:nucleotide exchange factor GrpE n=1 Tax=Gordonia rubripertincta TaxID=36822 RepID=UPI000B8D5BDF|nr:nucleotide exchange factor GrpE [Gordonia rubripertincta]ASR03711.1 heat shock protein GrpE [Gordonia rubripertincta]